MGDETAPKEFLKPFHDAMTAWHLRKPAMQPAFCLRCPELVDDVIDSSIASFADDAWKKFLRAKVPRRMLRTR
jgi:hypothetical protein